MAECGSCHLTVSKLKKSIAYPKAELREKESLFWSFPQILRPRQSSAQLHHHKSYTIWGCFRPAWRSVAPGSKAVSSTPFEHRTVACKGKHGAKFPPLPHRDLLLANMTSWISRTYHWREAPTFQRSSLSFHPNAGCWNRLEVSLVLRHQGRRTKAKKDALVPRLRPSPIWLLQGTLHDPPPHPRLRW